jgi:hypothetical protein
MSQLIGASFVPLFLDSYLKANSGQSPIRQALARRRKSLQKREPWCPFRFGGREATSGGLAERWRKRQAARLYASDLVLHAVFLGVVFRCRLISGP